MMVATETPLFLMFGLGGAWLGHAIGRIDNQPGESTAIVIAELATTVLLLTVVWSAHSTTVRLTDRRLLVVSRRRGSTGMSIRLTDIAVIGFHQSRVGGHAGYGTVWVANALDECLAVRDIVGAQELYLAIIAQMWGTDIATAARLAVADQRNRMRRAVFRRSPVAVECEQPRWRMWAAVSAVPNSRETTPMGSGYLDSTSVEPDGLPVAGPLATHAEAHSTTVGCPPAQSDRLDAEFRLSGLCICHDCNRSAR